jgi:uncharacterized membrane protein YkoI
MCNVKRSVVALSLLSFFILVTSNALSQDYEKRVKMKDLPKPVQRTVLEQSKGATLRALSKEVEKGKTFYEAELRVNGHNKDLLIDPTGAVVEVEEEVPLASVPAAVRATIAQNAGRGRIVNVESVTRNSSVVAYEAHIKAGRWAEIKVAADGKLITKEK